LIDPQLSSTAALSFTRSRRAALRALCAAMAALCCAAQATAQAVTQDELTHAQQAAYRDTFEARIATTNQLARRLTQDTDPAIILDVIELQLRTRSDGLQAGSLNALAAAGAQLAETIRDAGRAAMLRHYVAESVFWSDQSDRGFQLALAALNRQRDNVSADGRARAPSLLYRQHMRYAKMLQSKQFDDVAVDILKQAEKLLPQVDDQGAANIQAALQNAEVKLALGDNEAALAELLKAETSARALRYDAWIGTIAERRAALQIDLLQLNEAERYYQNLLASTRPDTSTTAGGSPPSDEQRGAANVAYNANSQLAAIAYLRNQPVQHYAFAKAALDIARRFDDGADLAYAWLELASAAASKKGALAEAQFALSEAERLSLPPRSIRRSLAIVTARTEISAALGDADALRALSREQNELRTRQDILRQQLQTRVAMAVFDVNNRDLKMQLLERSNAINELQAREDQTRNVWQRVAIITTSALLLVVLVASVWLYRRARDLQKRNQTDALTGALSRSAILDCARRGYSDSKHKRQSLAVCLLDFDRFKAINDEHGHEAGDIALRKAVATIKQALREGDAIGRIGGDEFLVIMVNANEAAAAAVAERIRAAVNTSVVMYKNARLRIAVSAGVAATGNDSSRVDSATALINEADAALLTVKREGRNAVGIASGAAHPTADGSSHAASGVTT
jgi:diguanylate cyclase (GGDEF)-like protein